jgi:hypothetical protein
MSQNLNKMKKIAQLFVCLFISFVLLNAFKVSDKITAEKILAKMYKRYNGKWFKNFVFSQTTENFRKDSLIKTSQWHETIVYPDHFRITFGEPADGNAIIYVNDSSFLFKNAKLIQKGLRTEDMPFILGGMYFMSFDSVKTKMVKEGFDITKAHESVWQGKKAYVIGSNTDEEKTNQLWIDKEKLVVVRFVKFLPSMKQEAIMNDQKKMGNGFTETTVIFNINDKLYQKEKYYDCKVNTTVDMNIFDPYNFKK